MPSRWVPALESYPGPYQASRALLVSLIAREGPGYLSRTATHLKGPPGFSDGLIVAWVAFQGWRLPPGLLDGLRGVWEAPQG